MQVSVDGLKPLIKEAIVEFGSGEELTITLTYEGLENHCSVCNQLDHVTKHCPSQLHRRNYATEAPSRDMSGSRYPHTSWASYGNQAQHNPVHSEPSRSHHSHTDFSNRVDRHDRPFGERAPTIPPRGQPLRNKVTPLIQSEAGNNREYEGYRPRQPLPRPRSPARHTRDYRHSRGSPSGRDPVLQWRERRTAEASPSRESNAVAKEQHRESSPTRPHWEWSSTSESSQWRPKSYGNNGS